MNSRRKDVKASSILKTNSQQIIHYRLEMARIQTNDKYSAYTVLYLMLQSYHEKYHAYDTPNIRFVNRLLALNTRRNRNSDSASKAENMLLAIAELNTHIHTLEHDDLISILSVFFLAYQQYQFNLSEKTRDMLLMHHGDLYQSHLNNTIEEMIMGMKGVSRSSPFYTTPDWRLQIRSCKSLGLFKDNLPDHYLKQVINGLLCHLNHEKSSVSTQAYNALLAYKRRISPDNQVLVVNTIRRMCVSGSNLSLLSDLIGEFYCWLPESDAAIAIKFLLENRNHDTSAERKVISVLIKLTGKIPQTTTKELVSFLLEQFHHAHQKNELFMLLLLLRQQVGSDDVDSITRELESHIQSVRSQAFILEKCFFYFHDNEKQSVMDFMLDSLSAADNEKKLNALQVVIKISAHFKANNSLLALFDQLYLLLQSDCSCQKTVLLALMSIHDKVPFESKTRLAQFLIARLFDAMPNVNLSHQVALLAHLGDMVLDEERDKLTDRVSELLDSDDHSIEIWACRAVANMAAFIPISKRQVIIDKLVAKLNWSNDMGWGSVHTYTGSAADEAAISLARLLSFLPANEQSLTAMVLFDIICDAKVVISGKNAAMIALKACMSCVDMDMKVAMLNRLMPVNNKSFEYQGLLLSVYQAYQSDVAKCGLGRVLNHVFYDLNIDVPSELAEHICRFTP